MSIQKKIYQLFEKRSEKLSNSFHLRYPCGMLTLLKLLFTRIETRKLRTFFENSDNCTISKQNLLLNNLFGTYQFFKIILTALMESTQNVANPQLKSENFVLFPARRIAFENEESSTPNLISSLERSTYSSFLETSGILHIFFSF